MICKRVFEINGNLITILNYDNFEKNVCQVRNRFVKLFGAETMSRIPLYVDNATETSGYTPIITPVLGQYLCIKLGIKNFLDTEQIIFQFAHELCHYAFYSLLGLDKSFANNVEESICTAMSLCILKDFYRNIQSHIDYVKRIDNLSYRNGVAIAESANYDSNQLSLIVLKETENMRQSN